jgi:hypothetical protein
MQAHAMQAGASVPFVILTPPTAGEESEIKDRPFTEPALRQKNTDPSLRSG